MMKPNFKQPQIECNKNVTDQYFIGFSAQESMESQIFEQIKKVAEKYSPKGIYIGISGHPCGRFTGYYENTTPVPPPMMKYQYKNPDIVKNRIDEAAHAYLYSEMHLICHSRDKEYMKELEKRAINFGYENFPEQMQNKAPGGEGDPQLEMVYLYVCISNQVI